MSPRGARILAALTLAVALLVVAAFVRLRYFSTLPLVAAGAVGCAVYLVASRRPELPEEPRNPLTPATRHRIRLLAATGFFLLSAGALGVAASAPYTKPLAYYGLVSAAAAAVAAYVGLVETERHTGAALGMVTLLALNIFGSSALAFPLGIGGADSPTHINFLVLPIVETGTIHQGNLCGLIYGAFPAHHVLVAMLSILAASDPALTYYSLGFLVMVLPVVVAFLLGRALFGARVGLYAALLLSGASYYISWASHAAPLTYAIPPIALLMLVLAKSLSQPSLKWYLPAVVAGLALILTHPYSSLIFGIILLGMIVGQGVFRPGARYAVGAIPAAGAIYGFLLFFDWINFSCLMTKSFQLAVGWVSAFTEEAIVSPPAVYDALPLSWIFANTTGDVLLLALAVVGFFAVLSRKLVADHMLVLGSMVTLVALSMVGLVTTLVYILPNRVYVYLQFLALAPLAAVGLRHLILASRGPPKPRRTWATLAVAAVLVGAFVFASATSSIAGFETSPLTGDRPYVKLYDTRVEEEAANWVCARSSGAPRVEVALSFHGLPRHRMESCLLAQNTTVEKLRLTEDVTINMTRFQGGSLVVFSRYDFDPGFQATITGVGQFGRGVYERLDPEELERLGSFDRVYDSGAVNIFRIPP